MAAFEGRLASSMTTKRYLAFSSGPALPAPASSAAEETADLGPYRVSFSLGSGVCPGIQVAEPVEGRTPSGIDYVEHSAILDSAEGRAQIRVTVYHSPVPAGDDVTRALSRKAPAKTGYISIETKSRLVDGHTGSHTTFKEVSGGEVHQVAYWLDRHLAPGGYLGETSCVISSSLPWTATRELFDTVHLEKVEADRKSSTKETVTAGPYQVSFDLAGESYAIVQEESLPGEDGVGPGTERQRVILDGGNRAATIEITGRGEFGIVNLGTERLLAEAALASKGYTRMNSSEWTIGGEAGVLGVGEDEDHQILYVAIFWPDQVQTEEGRMLGMTRCEIESSFWWGTTERLLDTIKVERRDGS